jgi:23S rRNA (uracil1939-C5)-methyltransferase
MIDRQNLNLIIEHIDPLGQGVAKVGDKIYFVPKTLPGEKISAKIVNKSKGVHFCEIDSILEPAANRIKAECPHFDKCRGCHFLHTDYQSEIALKKSTLLRSLTHLGLTTPEIQIVTSHQRTKYRNRLQLHYSWQQNLIGFHSAKGKIIPINNCILAVGPIQQFLIDFIPQWKAHLPQNQPKEGHIEISFQNQKLNYHWNKNYAFDGFTQVNEPMNLEMQNKIKHLSEHIFKRPVSIVDLFSGNGNLSNNINYYKRWMIDAHSYEHADFHQANLFDINELSRLKTDMPARVDLMIIDPPRQGFEHIDRWLQQTRANYLIYVSCHHQTMLRDLAKISQSLQILEVVMFEMFPSTYHFETLVFVKLV